jgi:hypothetical protein
VKTCCSLAERVSNTGRSFRELAGVGCVKHSPGGPPRWSAPAAAGARGRGRRSPG